MILRWTILACGMALMILASTAIAEAPQQLELLRERFENRKAAAVRPVLIQYERDLKYLQEQLTRGNDLTGAAVVEEDLIRQPSGRRGKSLGAPVAYWQIDLLGQLVDDLLRFCRGGLLDEVVGPVRREQADEVLHVSPQDLVPRKAEPCRYSGEKALGGHRVQVLQVVAEQRHRCNDADPHAHAYVGLDDIGVARCENDLRLEVLFGKRLQE